MLDKLWRRTVLFDEELNALRSKAKQLAAVESDNSTLVENAEIQPGKKRKREVELWFTHVEHKKATIENIETEFKEKGPSNNLKRHIAKHTKEVDELIQQGKFPKGVVLDHHASTRLPLVTTELVGQCCSKNIECILSWLEVEDALAIGIHGMGGVGKTAVMKHIHNVLLDIERHVYWVTASQECSIRKLQIDIGKVLGLGDLEQYDEERRKASLFQKFSQLGKFVLFIDDLWKHYPIEEIGIPCSLGGYKMIFSTRSLDVCNRMKCHRTIKIVPLSSPDAMQLFVKNLGAAVPIALNPIAEMILEECRGLPLALKTMGCCMRGIDDVNEWENALLQLRSPEFTQDYMKDEVFRVLKFSYNNLNDKKLQHCFLSCSLFPEDHKIYRPNLVRLWTNEGLLDEVESEKLKVNRGQAILNILVKSCLLESVNNEWVKMHDLVRDMAIIITQDSPRFMAKSGTRLEQMPKMEQWSEDLLKVSLSFNHLREIPSDLAPMTMKLSWLLLNKNLGLKQIPQSFFLHMIGLRVLDLSHTEIERLPDSVSEMKNLRVLLLRFCRVLRYVPVLEKLVNLRILDLSWTKIERLPESVSNLENLRELSLACCTELTYVPSLARLTNLRVLNLENGRQLERAPRGLEGLKKVEELPYCPWNVNDMIGFCRLLKSSPPLRCYRFWLSPPGDLPHYKTLDDKWIEFLKCNKTIWINGAEFAEDETVLVPITIESLRIEECQIKGRSRRLGDVFSSLGEATNLKNIHIQQCAGLEYITWSCIVASRGFSFSNLERLEIHKCPNIKEVFPISLTNYQLCFPRLVDLEVSECEALEQIFVSNVATPPNLVLDFPNLKYVEFRDLPKLRNIYMGLLLFTHVHIKDCPKLKWLEDEEVLMKSPSGVICNASSSKLAFITSERTKGWWEELHEDCPYAASEFYILVNEAPPNSPLSECEDNNGFY